MGLRGGNDGSTFSNEPVGMVQILRKMNGGVIVPIPFTTFCGQFPKIYLNVLLSCVDSGPHVLNTAAACVGAGIKVYQYM